MIYSRMSVMTQVIITDKNFEEEVLQSKIPVLVDFWAAWCGPCQMLSPTIEEIAKEYEGKVKVVKVDVDTNQITAQKYNILSIPTVILLKGGQPVTQVVGVAPKEKFEEEIKKVLEG